MKRLTAVERRARKLAAAERPIHEARITAGRALSFDARSIEGSYNFIAPVAETPPRWRAREEAREGWAWEAAKEFFGPDGAGVRGDYRKQIYEFYAPSSAPPADTGNSQARRLARRARARAEAALAVQIFEVCRLAHEFIDKDENIAEAITRHRLS